MHGLEVLDVELEVRVGASAPGKPATRVVPAVLPGPVVQGCGVFQPLGFLRDREGAYVNSLLYVIS